MSSSSSLVHPVPSNVLRWHQMLCTDIWSKVLHTYWCTYVILCLPNSLGTPCETALGTGGNLLIINYRILFSSSSRKPVYRRQMVHRGEYRAQAPAKIPNHSRWCHPHFCGASKCYRIKGSSSVRNANYYLTLEAQERFPHELQLPEPDTHKNEVKDKTQ